MKAKEAAILHLTLHRHWFDEIAAGRKTTEYRECSPFWIARLEGKRFDEIHFRNGYRPDAPFMRVECLGISVVDGLYHINLGKILEIRNYWSEIPSSSAIFEPSR